MDNTIDKKHKYFILLLLFVITFFISLLTTNNILRRGVSLTDSSVFIYIGKLITKGGIPYRDTFDHKGPLLYLINAVGYILSPRIGIWIIELFFLFSTVYYIYKISSLFVDEIKSIIVTIVCISQLSFFLEGGNFTEEYAMPFIAYALFVFIDYFKNNNITKLRLVLTGFSFMSVCLLRVNMVSVWIVFCIAVLVKCMSQHNYKDLGKFLFHFIIGALIMLLPIMLWLIFNNALDDFFKTYIIFNMTYTGSNGSLKNIVLSMVTFYKNPIVTITFMSIVFLILKNYKTFDIIYFLFMVATMLLMCMSGNEYNHYAMVLVPLFAYPVARLIESLQNMNLKINNIMLLAVVIMLLLPNLAYYGGYVVINRDYSEYDAIILNVSKIIQENTEQGDKIIVNGNKDCIYLLSDRDSLSKYSYQSPIGKIDSKIAQEYYGDIKSKKAKIIVLYDDIWNYEYTKKLVEELGYHSVLDNLSGDYENYPSIYMMD